MRDPSFLFSHSIKYNHIHTRHFNSTTMTSFNTTTTNFNDLIGRPPFKCVKRIPYNDVADMNKLVHETVMVRGSPLVVNQWHKSLAWNRSIFKWNYLKKHHGNEGQ